MSGELKQLIHNVWSMTVLRIGTDAANVPFVEIRIKKTGQERRLYVGDNLDMVLDLDEKKSQ